VSTAFSDVGKTAKFGCVSPPARPPVPQQMFAKIRNGQQWPNYPAANVSKPISR
jgi:hypothetical protein